MIKNIVIKLKTLKLCENGEMEFVVQYSNIEANPISKE